MQILLTNDDGINAIGIKTLALELSKKNNVVVVAPEVEKSATSAAITINLPLWYKEYKENKFASYCFYTNGTPADCVKLALSVILPKINFKPDVLISGINHGPNLGIDIRYSGTVAAAFEGMFMDIPSIAVSISSYLNNARYDVAADFISNNLEMLYEICLKFKNKIILNVNVPSKDKNEIKGYKFTKINDFRYNDLYNKLDVPSNNEYYWLFGKRHVTDDSIETDVVCVENDYISITPLKADLTDYEILSKLNKILNGG